VVGRYFDDRWSGCIHRILFEVDRAHVYEGGRKAGDCTNPTGFERASMVLMAASLLILGILPMLLWNYISPTSEMLFRR
jgi:hypothetical protein